MQESEQKVMLYINSNIIQPIEKKENKKKKFNVIVKFVYTSSNRDGEYQYVHVFLMSVFWVN